MSSYTDGFIWVALPCSLKTLMDIGDFVATEEKTCRACGKPATQSCARCRGVKYCSKVSPLNSIIFVANSHSCRNVKSPIGRRTPTNANVPFSKPSEIGSRIVGINSTTFAFDISFNFCLSFFQLIDQSIKCLIPTLACISDLCKEDIIFPLAFVVFHSVSLLPCLQSYPKFCCFIIFSLPIKLHCTYIWLLFDPQATRQL